MLNLTKDLPFQKKKTLHDIHVEISAIKMDAHFTVSLIVQWQLYQINNKRVLNGYNQNVNAELFGGGWIWT